MGRQPLDEMSALLKDGGMTFRPVGSLDHKIWPQVRKKSQLKNYGKIHHELFYPHELDIYGNVMDNSGWITLW